jgi:hypothetical protein
MRFSFLLAVLCCPAWAQETSGPSSQVATAIDRGLSFLTTDALAWKKDHHCVSCHHASLVVWSMREAKARGHAVDEGVLAELTRWVAESGDGKNGGPRPASVPQAANSKAIHFALALGADPAPEAVSQTALKQLLGTVTSDQADGGRWFAWPETRPPIFGASDESLTALAGLALLPAAKSGDSAAKAALDKAARWLVETTSDDDPQSTAMRLVLWRRLDRKPEECQPLVDRILTRQNADGGWSQSPDMASDAWATGQALYALAIDGFTADRPAIARARAFLIRSQRDDGSWPMTSRPVKPGGEGSKSLIPITAAGSAWAVLGLARSR